LNINDVTILIVDDAPVNVKIIQKFLEPKGFNVICAFDGRDAVDKYREYRPDIILMDVMMPVKDGYEATKEIKVLSGDVWVPVIFLSAKSTIDDQVFGIKMGGDDYLTKPVDLSMLGVKLDAMLRIVDMQRKLAAATVKLQSFADKTRNEIDLARKLMDKMSERDDRVVSDDVKYYVEAMDGISGDIALSFQCESASQSYFLLADATGHGLASAISLVPLSQLFYRLASHGHGVTEIAIKINADLASILPPERFVAATIGFVDRAKNQIEIWNGANPPPRIVSSKGRILHSFEKNYFCLGIVPENTFSPCAELYQYDEDCEMLFFSDGVIDARNTNAEKFGNDGIVSSITSPLKTDQTAFDKLLADLNAFVDPDNKVDDVCVLSVKCNLSP